MRSDHSQAVERDVVGWSLNHSCCCPVLLGRTRPPRATGLSGEGSQLPNQAIPKRGWWGFQEKIPMGPTRGSQEEVRGGLLATGSGKLCPYLILQCLSGSL